MFVYKILTNISWAMIFHTCTFKCGLDDLKKVKIKFVFSFLQETLAAQNELESVKEKALGISPKVSKSAG